MALPIHDMTRPSVLAGQPNGRLPASLLTTIAMPGGGTAVVLAQCAPKWQALLAAAAAAGFRLSQVGDYRTYDEQVALLKARYIVVTSGSWNISWDGKHWRKKRGMATVATPGRSNHGWGLALDLCMAGGASITGDAVDWLCAHAHEYGISAEIQSEDWHWRPYDGDAYAPAVTRYLSQSTQEEDMPYMVRSGEKDGTVVLVHGALAPATGKVAAHHITSVTVFKAYEAAGITVVQLPEGVTVAEAGIYDLEPGPAPSGGAPAGEFEFTGHAKPAA